MSLAGIANSLEQIRTITSSTAQHVLRTERNTDNLLEDVKNRLPPNHEYWYGLLQEALPGFMSRLPRATADHLIDASSHRFAKEWDYCKVSLCKSVESLFLRIFVSGVQALPESSKLTMALPKGKQAPRKRSSAEWDKIQMSGWVQILRTATEVDINFPLRSLLPNAFPNIHLDSLVNLHVGLAQIAKLRGGSAYDSANPDEQKAKDAQKLWDLVVGSNGEGLLAKFYLALGLTEESQGAGNGDGSS